MGGLFQEQRRWGCAHLVQAAPPAKASPVSAHVKDKTTKQAFIALSPFRSSERNLKWKALRFRTLSESSHSSVVPFPHALSLPVFMVFPKSLKVLVGIHDMSS